jgi:hypothetical protein
MGRTFSTNGEKWNVYRTLVGKSDGKRPLGRPRSRWVDNIKMDLREIGWDVVDWIDLAQDRDQNLRVLSNAAKFLSSYTIDSFSKRAQLHE